MQKHTIKIVFRELLGHITFIFIEGWVWFIMNTQTGALSLHFLINIVLQHFKHPDTKWCSGFKPNNSHWLYQSPEMISAKFQPSDASVSDCCMSAAPVSDHSVITLGFKPSAGEGSWRFCSMLLKFQAYFHGVKSPLQVFQSRRL